MKLALFCLVFVILAVSGRQFTAASKQLLIDLHNKARSDMVPPAHPSYPVPPLVWNDDAAAFASSWAEQCRVGQHSMTPDYGENIWNMYPFQSESNGIEFGMKFFEGEEVGFSFDSTGTKQKCDYSKTNTCGHYTQLVWRNTTSFGCAYAICNGNQLNGVCNYQPHGNWLTPSVAEVPYFPNFYAGHGGSSGPAPPPPSASRTPAPSATRTSVPSASRTPAAAAPPPAASASPTPAANNVCSPSCGANFACQNRVCVCPSPYVLSGSSCTLPATNGNGAYMDEFSTSTSSAVTVPDDVMIVQATSPTLLKWTRSAQIVDALTTRNNFNVQINRGTFGFAVRVGGTNNPDDRVEMRWENINNGAARLKFCYWVTGMNGCWDFGNAQFPAADGLRLKTSLTLDGSNTMIVAKYSKGYSSWQYSGSLGAGWNNKGAVGYYFDVGAGSPRPSLNSLVLATSTSIIVTLDRCIDTATWNEIFYELTPNANPSTTKLTILNGNNGVSSSCSAKSANGKELVSALTFVVTSTSVPSVALADTFVASSSSASGAAAGISTAGVVGGAEGAALAGSPTTTAGLAGPVATLTAGSAAGGAGGAGGGLSGGAIAGIVIGSVAGGVLLLGVTGLVVGAVVVGAVVVARGGDDNSSVESGNGGQRRSMRQTIRGFFGGVDVMSNNPNGHQSITARSPAMK